MSSVSTMETATRRVLAVTVALILASAAIVTPASAEDDIDGTYETKWVVRKTCEIGPRVGYKTRATVIATRTGPTKVTLDLQTPMGKSELKASIDTGLNFDGDVGGATLVGHFTLNSDGSATIAGEFVMPFCTGALGAKGDVTFSYSGPRRSGSGAEPPPDASLSPSPIPPGGQVGNSPGIAAAESAIERFCPYDKERPTPECDLAGQEAQDWVDAMREDLAALKNTPEEVRAISELVFAVAKAAELGNVQVAVSVDGKCVMKPAYPLANALLPLFGKLFVQGAIAAGNDRLDEVKDATARANLLLVHVTNAELSPLPSGTCPS